MRVKSEARRQAIVDVAKEAFSKQGFENTSMSEIASRVGGSKATLYNYFSSKAEIFAAVMESSAHEQIAAAFDLPADDCDIRTFLLNLGLHYLNFVIEPEIMAIRKMAINEADRSEIGRQFYENGPKKGWLKVSRYLQQQMDRKKIIAADAWVCAMHLKGLLESEVVEPYALGVFPHPDKEALNHMAERAINVFLRAYQL